MTKSSQPDTGRRVLTSIAVLGATLVLFDGGRGLTGRAGGGSVGCGGEVEAPDFDRSGQPSTYRDSSSTVRIDDVELNAGLQLEPRNLHASDLDQRGAYPADTAPLKPRTHSLLLPRPGPHVVDVLSDIGARQFAELIRRTGFDRVLTHPYQQFTIFAPSDPVITRLMAERPELWDPANTALLVDFIAHHCVAEELRFSRLVPRTLPSLLPQADLQIVAIPTGIEVHANGGNRATIDVTTEVIASNGVVFQVDEALVPRFTLWSHLRNAGFTSFASALEATGQVSRFSDPRQGWTVFAPSNAAFRASGWTPDRIRNPSFSSHLAAIIEGHVLPGALDLERLSGLLTPAADGALIKVVVGHGAQPTVSRAGGRGSQTVENPDIAANPGFVHGIGGLLFE